MSRAFLTSLLVTIVSVCFAQKADSTSYTITNEGKYGERSYLFGYGRSCQLDTYLSPLEYTGPQYTILTRIDRPTRWAKGRIDYQGTFQGSFTMVNDANKHGEEWGGHVGYDAGWYYRWNPAKGLTLKAGGLIGADVGFLYNLRNSNNPAQARVAADLSASGIARYDFHIRRARFGAMYQADLPLVGLMFSPGYGQSYYEISEGSREHNIRCTYPVNAFSIRQLLTIEWQLRRYSIRAGYLWDVRQSGVNGIKIHDISHSFMLGFVKKFGL